MSSQYRVPFDPPYTWEDLPRLDELHNIVGLGKFWLASISRAEIEATKPRPKKTVPLTIYRDGERQVIGEVDIEDSGHGTFRIIDEFVADNLLGIRVVTTDSFSIKFKMPHSEEGEPNADD